MDFLRALLVDKLLVDDARLPDLIHAYILIKRCHLLLRMAVDCRWTASWVPREERRAAAVLLVIALAADKHHVMVSLRPGRPTECNLAATCYVILGQVLQRPIVRIVLDCLLLNRVDGDVA